MKPTEVTKVTRQELPSGKFRYTAVLPDGSTEILLKASRREYTKAHQHTGKVKSGTGSMKLGSFFSFGKTPSSPWSHKCTFEIESKALNSGKTAPKSRSSAENPLVVSFGGGVGSTALIIGLAENNIVPDEIVFVDMGGESSQTYDHVEDTIPLLLDLLKFPKLTVLLGKANSSYASQIDEWVSIRFAEHLASGGEVDRAIGSSSEEIRMTPYGESWKWMFPLCDWEWTQKDCIEKIGDWSLDPVGPTASPGESVEAAPVAEWVTGHNAARSGLECFVHIIRGPDDPKRLTREQRKGMSLAWVADLKDCNKPKWIEEIVALLSDGVERTFNRICLEVSGGNYTADVCLEKSPDNALWELVAQGDIEHTMAAPVLFRLVRCPG